MNRDWMDSAACRSYDPELWFPISPGDTATRPRAICVHECPVRAKCAEYAIRTGEQDGIWGGMSQAQLTQAVRNRRAAGRTRVTAEMERRDEAARLMRAGMSNREIATALGLSRDTIARYLREAIA